MKKMLLAGMALLAATSAQSALAQTAPESQSTAATTQPGVTLITMHMEQAQPEDVFAELAKQGGVKFNNNGNIWEQEDMQTPIDVDIVNKPFWDAMKQICAGTGVSPQPAFGMNSPKKIQLDHFQGAQQHDWDSLPTFESQGVMVQARSFNRQQVVDYGKQGAHDYSSVQLFVYVDPGLVVQNFSQNVKASEAVDDAGHSMLPDGKNNMFYGGMQPRALIYQCQIPLKYPETPAKKIAHLKCILNMRVGSKMDSLSVDKPVGAAETTKVFGDKTVVFESAKKNGAMYEVKVGVSSDGNGGNQWGMLQNAQLLDAKGRAFNYAGGGGGGGDNAMEQYTINYSSNGGGGNDDNASPDSVPSKWVIELPTDSHMLKIPVEFSDLALP